MGVFREGSVGKITFYTLSDIKEFLFTQLSFSQISPFFWNVSEWPCYFFLFWNGVNQWAHDFLRSYANLADDFICRYSRKIFFFNADVKFCLGTCPLSSVRGQAVYPDRDVCTEEIEPEAPRPPFRLCSSFHSPYKTIHLTVCIHFHRSCELPASPLYGNVFFYELYFRYRMYAIIHHAPLRVLYIRRFRHNGLNKLMRVMTSSFFVSFKAILIKSSCPKNEYFH